MTTPSYVMSNLQHNTTYYWQVVAHNSGGATTGPVWSFMTVPKVTPTITWGTPASIVYGTALTTMVRQPAAAKALIDTLALPSSAPVIKKNGMDPA